MRRIVVVFIFMLVAAVLHAQNAPLHKMWHERPLSQNNLAYWYQDSPLGRSQISDITQDSTGYIWMASTEGVLRFDGNEAKIYDLNSVKVFNRDEFKQIVLSPDGVLWASSNENLYYKKDYEFEVWEDSLGQLKEGISRLEFDAKGKLWAVAQNTLYRVDGNSATKDPFKIGKIENLIKCQQNLLWAVNTQGDVFTIEDDNQFTPMPFLKDMFRKRITHVIGNIDRAMYVVLENGDLFRVFNGEKTQIKWAQDPKPGVTGDIIHSLMADSQGFIWVLSHENLYRIDGVVSEEVNWSFASNDFHVDAVFEDRDGDFWIGTYSGVAFLYQSAVGFMEYYESAEAALTSSVLQDSKGNVWVGSVNFGLLMIKGHKVVKAPGIGGLPKSIKTIAELENGDILLGGDEGIHQVRYNGERVSIIKKISNRPTRAVFRDKNGTLWLNQQQSNNQYYLYTLENGLQKEVEALKERRTFFFEESSAHGLVIGTDAGLYSYKNDSFRLIGKDLGFDKENFVAAIKHHDNLWISSKSRGLIQLSADSISIIDSRKNFKIKNSSSMLIDDQEGVWFGVNFGVFYMPLNEFEGLIHKQDSLNNVEFFPINSSDNSEGYPLNWKASSGEIFMTTDRGLVEIHPDFRPDRKPVLDIESYSITNEVIPIQNNEIRLSGEEGNLAINYSGIDFLNYANLEFEFTLEGFDEQWHKVGQRTTAVYTNLPKGTYTFKLRLANRGEDAPIKTLTVIKEPCWYETVWFTVGVGLLGLFLMFLLIKWRTYRVREKNKNLKIEVDLRTAELKEVLNSLEDTVEERTETLTKALEQLNLAMEAGKLASYFEYYDDKGNLVDRMYAEQFYHIIGYQKDEFELSRAKWDALIHPDDAEKDAAQAKKIREQQEDNQWVNDYWVEYRIKHKTNGYKWIESMGRVVERHANGAIKRLVGVVADVNDRKQSEIERLEGEERFRHVFEAGSNGLMLVNKKGELELFNNRAVRIFNYSYNTFKNKNINQLIPACGKDESGFDVNCLKNNKPENSNGLYDGLHSDGSKFPVKVELTSIKIKDEELTLVVLNDMSHEMEMEQALEESKFQLKQDRDKYQSVFENINDAIFILEVDGDKFKYLEINSVDAEIIGYSKEEVHGKYTHELFPKISEYLDWRFASCRDTGEIVTYQERLKFQNEEQDFETSLVPILEDGRVVRIIGIAHDITELLKSQEVIREREEKLRFALEATQDAIIDWDFESGRVDVSPVLYRMLGYKLNTVSEHILGILKLINKSDFDISSEEEFKKKIQLLGDRSFIREFRMKMFDGSWLWVLMRGKVVKSETGDALRFIGTISDISKEKKKTKDKLEAILQTEDNERRRISREIHDGLQQTLTISALNLEFLKREISKVSDVGQKKYEQGWAYLQQAIAESRGVAHTLMPKAIVDFGLVSACKSLIMEYNNSVEGTFFHFNHNLEDESIIDNNIEVTLYRILQEALTNVIKYAEAKEVNVQLRDYNDILMLTVEDDGKGFDVQKARASDKGFGLRSMQNRIDAISGVLEIESAPGKGTVIVVQISKEILTEV